MRQLGAVLLVAALLGMCGCEDTEALKNRIQQLQGQVKSLRSDVNAARGRYEALHKEHSALQQRYAHLKKVYNVSEDPPLPDRLPWEG